MKVGNLDYASPSTVSRVGLIYVDPNVIGYKPYWTRWLDKRDHDDEKALLNQLFDLLIPGVINCITNKKLNVVTAHSQIETILPQVPIHLVCI